MKLIITRSAKKDLAELDKRVRAAIQGESKIQGSIEYMENVYNKINKGRRKDGYNKRSC